MHAYPLYIYIYIKQLLQLELFSSSDPHPVTLFWHIVSGIPSEYIYIYGIYIYILTFNLTFFLVYTLTFYLTFYLASILTYFLDFSSIIIVRHCFLHSIYSGILSGIYSGILSGMCSGPGRHGQLPPELAIGDRVRVQAWPAASERQRRRRGGVAPLSKSRDPHLTGGEKLHVCTYIYIHIYIYTLISKIYLGVPTL